MLLWEPILWDRYATVMSSTDSTILTCRRAHCSGTWFFLRHSHAALTEWGLYPHRSTDTRTSDPEIPRQARTHQLAPPSKETLRESESRAAFGLLFGAESVIQSRHMLHMSVKCSFMLHKVRMYEGPKKASFMTQIGSICILHILPMPTGSCTGTATKLQKMALLTKVSSIPGFSDTVTAKIVLRPWVSERKKSITYKP